ncbi:MAG: EamA family transporter [Chitinophagaceae bacterium]
MASFLNFTLLAVIIRILVNPFSNVLQKQITLKGQHPLLINLATYTVLAFISVFFIYDISIQSLDIEFWIYSIAGGITGALGNGFIVKALEKGDLSVLGPINAYKSIVGMLFAFIIIREVPNIWGLMGMGFIIVGSYFVLDTTEEKFSWQLFKTPAIQYRLAALVLTGIQAVLDKKVIEHSNLEIAFAGWSIFGAGFSFVFILFTKVSIQKEFKIVDRAILVKYFLLVLTVGLMLASTNYTLSHMPVGYALALFQLSILLSVVLGHRFFNELHLFKKLMGATIMVIGSALIILMK